MGHHMLISSRFSALVGEMHKELVSSSWWDTQGACRL